MYIYMCAVLLLAKLTISGSVYGLICPCYGSNIAAKYKGTKIWISFFANLVYDQIFYVGGRGGVWAGVTVKYA